MNTARFLSIIISFLVIYNGIMIKLVEPLKNYKFQKNETTKHLKPIDFDTTLQISAVLLLGALSLLLLIKNEKLFILPFLVHGTIIYTFIFISSIITVGELAISKGANPLTEDENGSLILVGILVALFGFYQSNNSASIFCKEISVIKCLLLVSEYSLYIFFICALIIRPIKDIANIVIRLINKIGSKSFKMFDYIINNLKHPKRKHVLSVWLLNKRREVTSWFHVAINISLIVSIPFDIVIYSIKFLIMFFGYSSIALMMLLIRNLGQYLLKTMLWIDKISSRQVAVISFKISIMTALLFVVISNRYEIIKTTEATTSILEFIASVVIIPIIFEWIHISSNEKNQQ